MSGENRNVNTLLLLALIVLPLVALLVFFARDIADFLEEQWARTTEEPVAMPDP